MEDAGRRPVGGGAAHEPPAASLHAGRAAGERPSLADAAGCDAGGGRGVPGGGPAHRPQQHPGRGGGLLGLRTDGGHRPAGRLPRRRGIPARLALPHGGRCRPRRGVARRRLADHDRADFRGPPAVGLPRHRGLPAQRDHHRVPHQLHRARRDPLCLEDPAGGARCRRRAVRGRAPASRPHLRRR